MGQKTNPIANRLGIIRGWESNWYGGKDAASKMAEDEKIRAYIEKKIAKAGIAKVVIERTLKRVTVTIHTSKPGIVIGKGGQDVELLKKDLDKLTGKEIQINIMEVKNPELDANIVGENICKQIEARVAYKRAIKMALAATMRAGAEGIKVRASGRLGGVEMARTEEFKLGRTPLHTFRADIDYTWKEALTIYGKIGVKVWICRGEMLGKVDLTPNQEQAGDKGGKMTSNRGEGGRDNRRGGGDREGNRRGGDREGNRRGGDRDRR
ncbi:MAG: 30S ribosomal protein S3 [Chitinophagales bacterium]|nr:30S ribosomal protein S3 [Chitinophagales bacterium]